MRLVLLPVFRSVVDGSLHTGADSTSDTLVHYDLYDDDTCECLVEGITGGDELTTVRVIIDYMEASE